MRISEYSLLQEAFHRSFGFMLNRLEDGGLASDILRDPWHVELVEERCFSEFTLALEEMGVELGDVEVPLREEKLRKANLGLAAALAESQGREAELTRRIAVLEEAGDFAEVLKGDLREALDIVEMEAARPTTSVGRILATITRERAALIDPPEPKAK